MSKGRLRRPKCGPDSQGQQDGHRCHSNRKSAHAYLKIDLCNNRKKLIPDYAEFMIPDYAEFMNVRLGYELLLAYLQRSVRM